MAHVTSTEFELQRRPVLLKANTNMADHSPLGFEAEPSTAVLGSTDGEDLIVNCPVGSQYMQANGTKWDKMGVGPAVWQKAGSGGGGGTTTLAITPDLILADGTDVLVTPQTDGVLSPRYFSPEQSSGQSGEVVYRKYITHILSGAVTDSVAVEAYMDKIVGFYLYSVGPANNFVLTDGSNGGRVTDINQNLITATVSLEQLGANIAVNGRELKGWIDYTLGDHVNAVHQALPTTVSAGNVMVERDKVNLNPQLVLADGTDLLADVTPNTRYFSPEQSNGQGEVVYRSYFSYANTAVSAEDTIVAEQQIQAVVGFSASTLNDGLTAPNAQWGTGSTNDAVFGVSFRAQNRNNDASFIEIFSKGTQVDEAADHYIGWVDYILNPLAATGTGAAQADHQPLPTAVGASAVLVERNVVDLEPRLVLADGTDSLTVPDTDLALGPMYFSPKQAGGNGSVVYRRYFNVLNVGLANAIDLAIVPWMDTVIGHDISLINNDGGDTAIQILNGAGNTFDYELRLNGRNAVNSILRLEAAGANVQQAADRLLGWFDFTLNVSAASRPPLPATVNATTPVVNNVVNYITQLARESDSVPETPIVQVAYFSPNQMDGLGNVVYRIYLDSVNDQSAFMTLISFPYMDHIINSHLTVFTTAINGEVIDFGGTTDRGIEVNLQSAGTPGAGINTNSRSENLTSNIYKGWFDFTVSQDGNPLPT